MNIVVFDTETVSLDKPFCYNIGYVIANVETRKILVKRDFVVEQIWHNLPLFSTAYYAEKRELYVSAMRGKRAVLDKFGYICRQMTRDFTAHNVEIAFAYNSPFDDKVFTYNCDWYKCNNPFDTIPIVDIRGFAHNFIVDEYYKGYCEMHKLFTETGNYSTTAESIYKYITDNEMFKEEHTALADSEIELQILFVCLDKGANINSEYQVYRSIDRECRQVFSVTDKKTKEVLFQSVCTKVRYDKKNGRVEITTP